VISRLPLAWRLARRELRGGVRGLGVFLGCLALGVAAIAAVGALNASVIEALERDANRLLGGDLELEVANLPLDEEEIAALVPPGARRSDIVRTNAMAYGTDGRRVAVVLKAVDDAYPLYGEVRLDPSMSLDDALAGGGAVVERGLLTRLGLELGDRIRIGDAELELRAVLEREPDRIGGFIGIGPRLMMPLESLAATGTIQPGSLARYAYRIALPPGMDAAAELERLRAEHPEAGWRARGGRDVQPRITRFTDRLAGYLTIAGLTALLIGGLGVGLSIQNYLRARTTTIATLKCLGAPSGLIFETYLMQVMVLAGAGVAIGLALGQAVPFAVHLLPAGLLPLDLAPGIQPAALAIAAACGILTALVVAVWPLARARDISAAGMFRSLIGQDRRRPRGGDLAWLALSLIGLAAFAVLGVADPELGGIFVGSAAFALLVLAALARLLLLGARGLGGRGSATARMALGNLHRPGSAAGMVIVALGAGLAVLTMVGLLWHNLGREIDLRLPERAPSVFFIDIQPDQIGRFNDLVAGFEGARVVQSAPVIRGRVVRIAGQPVDQTGIEHWTLRRDRGLSYAAAQPEGAELVAGEWWPEDYRGPPLISVEDEVAEAYGLGIGDRIGFNVLGRVIEAEIGSLRKEIDWGEARLDFVFIFSPGVLEAAPHTFAAAVEVPEAGEPALLDVLAAELPNVTPITVRELVAQLDEALGQIGLAVAAVGGVTLLAGILVLAGAIAAARRRHLYEAVVLKVLGARRADLWRVFLLEYLCLGVAGAIAGAIIGGIGAYAVVRFVFDLAWSFSPTVVGAVLALALLVTTLAGFVGTWRLLGRPAAPVLRAP
jgi:putative ABC transport system permease protein